MIFARLFEMGLAAWLVAGTALFTGRLDTPGGAWLAAGLVLLCSGLSFAPTLPRMHLGNGAIGLWLTIAGLLASRPASPADQNSIVIGLLLMMFAVVPTRAFEPPPGWRDAEARHLPRRS